MAIVASLGIRSLRSTHAYFGPTRPKRLRSLTSVVGERAFDARVLPDAEAGIADIAVNLAKTGASLQAWEAFEAKAVARCGALRGEEITRVLYACTLARKRPHRLLDKLAKDIPDKLPQFSKASLCVCLHAFAQLRRRESQLFSSVSRRLLNVGEHGQLEPPHVASLLYSHVKVLLTDKGLIEHAKVHVTAHATKMTADDLATAMLAFATLQVRDPQSATVCVRAAVQHAADAPLPLLCDTLSAFAKMGVSRKALQKAIVDRSMGEPASLDVLSATDMSKFLLGFADWAPGKDMCAIVAKKLGERLDELDGPHSYVQALEALSRACSPDDVGQAVGQELAKKIAPIAIDFSVKQIASMAQSCQELGVFEPPLLEALVRQGLSKGWRFRPRFAKVLLDTCAAANFDHPVVDELKESTQRLLEEAEEKRAQSGDGAERASSNSEDRRTRGRGNVTQGADESEPEQGDHEEAIERLLEAEESMFSETWLPRKRPGKPSIISNLEPETTTPEPVPGHGRRGNSSRFDAEPEERPNRFESTGQIRFDSGHSRFESGDRRRNPNRSDSGPERRHRGSDSGDRHGGPSSFDAGDRRRNPNRFDSGQERRHRGSDSGDRHGGPSRFDSGQESRHRGSDSGDRHGGPSSFDSEWRPSRFDSDHSRRHQHSEQPVASSDGRMRRLLRDAERDVLRPAGMVSETRAAAKSAGRRPPRRR